MKKTNIKVVDSIMGSGKTTWAIDNLINQNPDKNILYITPFLAEIDNRMINNPDVKREMYTPKNHGQGKIGNLTELIKAEKDIAATHELFRRFDDKCKRALEETKYTLILDEVLTAVEPYHFQSKDDYLYLLNNKDITVTNEGIIEWTGNKELDTRFNDVRVLAENKCLFRVDDKFFLWSFPSEIFELFEEVYILTYLFDGSIMKSYFELHNIKYSMGSISKVNGTYQLVDYYTPDKSPYRERLKIYNGKLNLNISQKTGMLSLNWSSRNQKELAKIKNNLQNYCRNIIKANSNDVMWTCHKSNKKKLAGSGYTKGFIACNARATNDYKDKTCLMYALNWFENPELVKFFKQRNIGINQDLTALSTLLQWIWRSNIRDTSSTKRIDIYIPSARMRKLLTDWLYA